MGSREQFIDEFGTDEPLGLAGTADLRSRPHAAKEVFADRADAIVEKLREIRSRASG